MIVNRFSYQKLTRKNENGVRLYSCPDGSRLPSVTSILSKTQKTEKKVALENWRNRIGHANAASITKEAGNRGTRMHTFLEKYMKDGTVGESGTNPFSIESHKMASHIVKNGLSKVNEFYGTEISLYYPSLYAGATDCVALYNGELAVCDFKQTNKPKKTEWIEDYFLQLSAYILSHDYLYDTKIKYGIVMMCDPKLTYQQWILEGTELEKYKEAWWVKLEEYYSKKFEV